MNHGISLWRAYAEVGGYTNQMVRDTLFLHLRSPQSREGDERKEAKLDALLRQLGREGERLIAELDHKYPRR
jgi:hypothetical protein